MEIVTRDVSDVTHRKRGLRFEKSQLVEFLPGKKKVDFRGSSWPDKFVRYGRRALEGLRADDVKAVSIEGLHLSPPYVEKPFNSKVIKSFVPELRSRQVFFVFRDSYVLCYLCALWTLRTFCVPVWICIFPISVFIYGYITFEHIN